MRKLYIDYQGVEYYDYDVYYVGNDKDSWNHPPKDNTIMLYNGTAGKIRDKIAALKNNPAFVPAKGDDICVIPDCKYNLEDIRRNYNIKRGYDKGTCNVFSEGTINKYCYYGHSFCVALVPSKKSAVISYYDDGSVIKAALQLFTDITKSDVILMTERLSHNSSYHFFTIFETNINDAYFKLLTGTLTKPAVHVDSLDLNTGEQLTVDALEIVQKLCDESVNSYSNGWDEKLKLQLTALNGLDWRKYPGTINVLLNGFLYRCDSAILEMKNITSRYPKNVKNFLKFSHEGFASKDDINLACSFARRILGLENTEFTTMKDIYSKLSEKKMMVETFFALFDNMVRFKDKEWKDE